MTSSSSSRLSYLNIIVYKNQGQYILITSNNIMTELITTTIPFQYPSYLLNSCAEHGIKHDDCLTLFLMHQEHYMRLPHHTNDPSRIYHFFQNVMHIYTFNKTRNNSTQSQHQVSLNKYSDLLENELPLNDFDDSTIKNFMDDLHMIHIDDINDIIRIHGDLGTSSHLSSHHEYNKHNKNTHHYHHNKKKHHTHKHVNNNHDKKILNVFKPFWTGATPSKKGADETFIQKGNKPEGNKVGDFVDGDWDSYLNWATSENPDGINLVHDVKDQGKCGSCWAFTATGTVETNVARHAAYASYLDTISKMTKSTKNEDTPSLEYDDLHRIAVESAQQVERDILSKLRLSVQELVDCDKEYNKGCIGGNPVFALPYIQKYGLVSDSNYPYVGKQNKCNKAGISYPVVTVDSWGLLANKDEDNMKRVLRYIGPIAVGFDGSDPSFLSYKSGIYSGGHCNKGPNHAMLIVGYGEEGKQKYWIARNSWGIDWGENGFVRIKRDISKKTYGVCGIARMPSVALGGFLLRDKLQGSSLKKTKSLKNGPVDFIEANSRLERGWSQPNFQQYDSVFYLYSFFIVCCIILSIKGRKIYMQIKCKSRKISETCTSEISPLNTVSDTKKYDTIVLS